MKNKDKKHWYENISEKGVLCWALFGKVLVRITEYNKNSDFKFISNDNTSYSDVTPITSQEWWQFTPWNYDMDSASKDCDYVMLKSSNGEIKMCFFGTEKWYYGDYIEFKNPIAWIPLPENKL